MRKFWLLFLILFITNRAFGFEIVYPKIKNPVIKGSTTFFIGNSDKPVTINGKNIPRHSTGAFAYFVQLPNQNNTFTIKSGNRVETYTIKKIFPQAKKNYKIIEYNSLKYFVVTKDTTPLRSTPVDAGINRIAHLQKGVLLTADGEKGDFYRIKLNDTKKAWVGKSYVSPSEPFTPAILKNSDYNENEKFYTMTFYLDKMVPFEITEGENINIKFYNTKKDLSYSFPYYQKTSSSKLYGYSGEYEGNNFILKIRKPPVINQKHPLKHITITVDAGHGGKEIGATGCLGDKEKDVVLNIAKYLEKELKDKGAKVIMTRESDKTLGLKERTDIANQNNSTVFISIHGNALPDSLNPNMYRGTSVYYYYNQAKPMAQTILNTMVEKLGTKNDNIHQQSFAVVRNTNALSVLIEVAYLINPYDNELLINPNFQKNTASAIAEGIERFFTK